MASSNPIATIVDETATLIQRFYVKKQHLSVDVLNVAGLATVAQTSLNPADGVLKLPSSLATVKRYGLCLVYGVLNVKTIVNEQPVIKPVLAQISPAVAPLKIDGDYIYLGDNVSVAATSDGKDAGWVYVLKQNGNAVNIIEYGITYVSSAEPTRSVSTISDILTTSRLAVAALPSGGLQTKRIIAWQTSNKSIRTRQIPSNQDDTVSTDNIMAQTPLAIVVKSVADTVQIFVYYISDSNRRLMRATKPLLAGAYQVQSVMPEDSLDDTSDLAVSSVPTGNLVSFMLKGNERYSNIVDQVGVTPS